MIFDPGKGETIRTPPAPGRGYWAGAPTVWLDHNDHASYLSYRLRRPRGVEPERGGETRIAVSTDGIHFEDIWRAEKSQFGSPSIERCSLARSRDGRWQYFVSFVDGSDGRWRVDRLEAGAVDELDPASREPVFTAEQLNIEGVKDPNVFVHGGVYWMLLSYVPALVGFSHEQLHGTADIYNTGLSLSCSAVASSLDGKDWQWQGEIMHPMPGTARWDAYATRVCCVIPARPVWLASSDGSRSVDENYEERTGLAVGGICPEGALNSRQTDLGTPGAYAREAGVLPAPAGLFTFRSITPDGPALVSPHASGSLRYIDAVPPVVRADRRPPPGPLDPVAIDRASRRSTFFYYEFARPDGSHELRVSIAGVDTS